MRIKYTSQDGWDVYSPTADAIKACVSAIESYRGLCNEVRNCVRTTDVDTIKENMLDLAADLKEYAERMDENVQFVTIGEADKKRWFKYLNEYGDIDTLCEAEKMSAQQAFNWVRTMQQTYVVTDFEER